MEQPQNHPYPELHVRPLAKPLLTGLGGGEDGHLLPVQLQDTRVLVPHHLQEDGFHWDISHSRSDPLSSCPHCPACPRPALIRVVPGFACWVFGLSACRVYRQARTRGFFWTSKAYGQHWLNPSWDAGDLDCQEVQNWLKHSRMSSAFRYLPFLQAFFSPFPSVCKGLVSFEHESSAILVTDQAPAALPGLMLTDAVLSAHFLFLFKHILDCSCPEMTFKGN